VKITPTTHRHQVGTCPACKCGLWAEVTVTAEVGTPYLDRDGKAHVNVTPRLDGMALTHECRRDDDGEWVFGERETCGNFAVHPETGAALNCDFDVGHRGPHRDGDTTWGDEK
jgi:hypothetical protein